MHIYEFWCRNASFLQPIHFIARHKVTNLVILFEGIPDQIYRIYIHYMPMARVKSVRNGKRATCELRSDTLGMKGDRPKDHPHPSIWLVAYAFLIMSHFRLLHHPLSLRIGGGPRMTPIFLRFFGKFCVNTFFKGSGFGLGTARETPILSKWSYLDTNKTTQPADLMKADDMANSNIEK